MTQTISAALSRRAFGKLSAATALATAATPAVAASLTRTPVDGTVLSLPSVPLAWPQYHKLSALTRVPAVGEGVVIERARDLATDEAAFLIHTTNGERLGAIPRRHGPALAWALERGDKVLVRVSKVAPPMGNEGPVMGWGAFHVDVTVSATATA